MQRSRCETGVNLTVNLTTKLDYWATDNLVPKFYSNKMIRLIVFFCDDEMLIRFKFRLHKKTNIGYI